MDYEKKYKEALEKFRKDLGKHELVGVNRAYLESIFPELAESEDERIKKAIKYGLDYVFTINTKVYDTTKEQCFAWLDKQSEQKIAVTPKFRVGDIIRYKSNPDDVKRVDSVMDDHYILDIKGECTHVLFTCQDLWELVEQKPIEWSKEDEKMLQYAIDFISTSPYPYAGDVFRGEKGKDEIIDWLKSLILRINKCK